MSAGCYQGGTGTGVGGINLEVTENMFHKFLLFSILKRKSIPISPINTAFTNPYPFHTAFSSVFKVKRLRN
jgi:hypothetical protein